MCLRVQRAKTRSFHPACIQPWILHGSRPLLSTVCVCVCVDALLALLQRSSISHRCSKSPHHRLPVPQFYLWGFLSLRKKPPHKDNNRVPPKKLLQIFSVSQSCNHAASHFSTCWMSTTHTAAGTSPISKRALYNFTILGAKIGSLSSQQASFGNFLLWRLCSDINKAQSDNFLLFIDF